MSLDGPGDLTPNPGRGPVGPSKWPISWFRVARLNLADGTAAFVTIHPSFLLRIKDEADKAREYRHFVADLRQAAKVLADQAA
jgi:DNA polymerase